MSDSRRPGAPGDGRRQLGDTTPLLPRWGDRTRALPEGAAAGTTLPEWIGPYRVVGRLGAGGMGEVFLVEDETLARRVALKRIRPDRAAGELRRRFEVEARVTALLQHPSIIPVYQLDTSEEDVFYTMRPVEGRTLADLLAELRRVDAPHPEWPIARLLRLFLQACNALAYAHARGVVHRDLKPSNIMIGPFEEVLVLDWGMAKLRDAPDPADDVATGRQGAETPGSLDTLRRIRDETASQVLVGTPAYMAPEQLAGRGADERSDVFALGVVLYELLTLRAPWTASTVAELEAAMQESPPDPALIALGRSIPVDLGRAVLKALSHVPDERHQTMAELSADVAHALEGRASWRVQPASRRAENWRMEQGRLRVTEDDLRVVRSRGAGRSFRYFCSERFGEDVSLDFEVMMQGRSELTAWLNASSPWEHRPDEGYSLQVLPGRRSTLSLFRSGRLVAGIRSPAFGTRRWYRVTARRQQALITLLVDGEEIYSYRDPIPLRGGLVGVTGQGTDLRLRGLRVSSLGASARVSCLSVPDAFFNRSLFEEAKAEYDTIARSLSGRGEGRLARFRSGLCLVEMARREEDPELRAMLLGEAREAFERGDAGGQSCLMALGRALVADGEGDAEELHRALARALEDFSDDPHLAIAHEWLLGRLHRVELDERVTVAALVPLAIRHCLSGWGRPLIQDLVRKVRHSWETPSFLSGRSRLRESDPATHADAELLFSFWGGRGDTIAASLERLVELGAARPHHLSDAYFALLELGRFDLARRLLQRIDGDVGAIGQPDRLARVLACCHAAQTALGGELEAAQELLDSLRPEKSERSFNSARLWLARSARERERSAVVRRALRPLDGRDSFAREHLAWFALLDGDRRQAEGALRPFVERGQHLEGRNLSNLLYGALRLLEGEREEANRTFLVLPDQRWPRSWTLGSYFASGRLEGRGWRDGSFPWERSVLDSHRSLLDAVVGEKDESEPG